MPWKGLPDIFARRLENVLKTFWRPFEDILARRHEDIWLRRLYWSWPRRLEDVLKTSSEDVCLRRTYSPWSRRLEDVFWRWRRNTSSRRLHQDECLLSCEVIVFFNVALYRSAFSTDSFRNLVFRLSVLSLNKDIKICVIMVCNFVLTLYKNSPFTNNKQFIKIL